MNPAGPAVPYSFKPHHTLSHDARRIVSRQLARAERELVAVGDARSDRAVHDARRHLKKVLALLRLLKPVLGPEFQRTRRPMRRASRLLAPIADAESLVGAADALAPRPRSPVSRSTSDSLCDALRRQEAEAGRKAAFDNVLPRVAALLQSERARVDRWALEVEGFDALAPSLERSVRKTKDAMARAAAHPRHAAYHAWRRRVKDLWFQVRLLEPCCGFGLDATRRKLETLDGLLGQYCNLVLLERSLRERPCLSRGETAACLRVIHRRRHAIRRRALALGGVALCQTPAAFVSRVAHMWNAARRSGAPDAADASSQRA